MPTHPLGQFLRGVTYPVVALLFLRRHRQLWSKAAAPVLINIGLLVTLCAWGWLSLRPALQSVEAYFQTMAADGDVIRYVIHGLMLVTWFFVLPVVVFMAGAVILMVGQCVAGPFLEYLSEHVECVVRGEPAPEVSWRRWRRVLFVALTDAIGGLVYLAVVATPLFLLSFIPVVGALASVATAAMLVSHQFVGLPLARQLVTYNDRWRLVVRRRWFCLGFGSAAVALLALPGLNMLLLPVATVGGTLLYCDLEKAELLDIY